MANHIQHFCFLFKGDHPFYQPSSQGSLFRLGGNHGNEVALFNSGAYATTTATATRTAKKEIGLDWPNNNFCTLALPSLHGYNVKMPNFTFCRGREHKTTIFFSFSEL